MPVWSRYFLLREMVKRDFQSRYAGSVLGFLWSMAQPVWTLVLFTFVFSIVMRFPLSGEPTDNFAIFLFCGLLPWIAVNEGVARGAVAITENADLVKKQRFPASLLVIAVSIGALIHAFIAAGIFALILAVRSELAWASLPLLGIALPLQLALTLGLGLSLAAVHVFYRDTVQIVGMALTGWFYFTPIVYPRSMLAGRPDVLAWLDLNPLTWLVGAYRAAFLGGGTEHLGSPLPIVLVALFSVLVGWAAFWRYSADFADEI